VLAARSNRKTAGDNGGLLLLTENAPIHVNDDAQSCGHREARGKLRDWQPSDGKVMNGDVTRLAEDLRRYLDSAQGDDLAVRLRWAVAAFIGRVAIREDGYAPAADMLPAFQAGRDTVASMLTHGAPPGLRSELLRELDKAIAIATPPRFPPNLL